MKALTAAARALWVIQHPGCTEDQFDGLNTATQIFWIRRAAPIAAAVVLTLENK